MSVNIENWLESLVEESKEQWDYQKYVYCETIPWCGEFKAQLEAEAEAEGAEGMLCGRGLLLTGPDGCGKHATATCMMKLLLDSKFKKIFISDLWLGRAGANEALDKLRGLLDRFRGAEPALCLVVENLEDYPFRREVLSLLGRKLRGSYLEMQPFFLILIDQDERSIPSLLRSRLQLYRVSLPNLNQRIQLITQNSEGMEGSFEIEYLAQITNGLTYAQLKDLVNMVYWLIESKKGETEDKATLSNEELLEFSETQMPQLAQEDAMPTIAKSLQKLVDELPKILENLPARDQPNLIDKPLPDYDKRVDQKKFIESERERIEKLPPRDLAVELFGEEGVQELEKAYEQQNQ